MIAGNAMKYVWGWESALNVSVSFSERASFCFERMNFPIRRIARTRVRTRGTLNPNPDKVLISRDTRLRENPAPSRLEIT